MRTRVKFCGCTSPEDAAMAAVVGADAIGLIFAPSPRRVSFEDAASIVRDLPPLVTRVGVFVDPTLDDVARARAAVPGLLVQLSGSETPESALELGASFKAIHVAPEGELFEELRARAAAYPGALPLFDTRIAGLAGGTGVAFDWTTLAKLAQLRPIVVAGGLTPQNVGECVRAVRPYTVDVRSGVETDGRKDRAKMEAFIAAVREQDET